MLNPYIVLGVSTSDSLDAIKTRYKLLCKKYHPDNSRTGDRKELEKVLEAWKIIQEMQENSLGSSNEIWGHGSLFSLKRRKI